LDPETDPEELVRVRKAETAAAGAILGVSEHHWLGVPDGEIGAEAGLVSGLVSLIRRVKPTLVVAPDPTAVFFGQHYINHRDHRAVGWATLDAVAPAAANPHYFRDAGPAHRVGLLYLSGTLEPDAWVDVSETIDAKTQAIACHTSQLGDTEEWLRTAVRQRAVEAGKQVAVPFAEAFRRIVLD
jgi:LmbE family N-acetylglucosaminyl deacetylase